MQHASREFVLTAGGGSGDDLPPPVGDKVRVAGGGGTRLVRRTWLDTFDWRLYRAGLTLELRSGRGVSELILTGRDGETVAVQPAGTGSGGTGSNGTGSNGAGQGKAGAGLTWPSLASALPPGPLREHLLPVSGIRALAPVARAGSAVTERRALNDDDKTVAIVAVERLDVTFPAPGRPPARLTVRPLRGYQPQAERLTEDLVGAGGIAEARQTTLEAVLAAAGRRPADYSSKINVQLDAAMPASLALAIVLHKLLEALHLNLPGTIADIDTEFLHDLRIAIRRTRSVLKSSAAVLPEQLVSAFRPEFKWLGDLTTPTRDLDVYLLEYPSMAAGLVGASADELVPFREHLERRRAAAQRALARGLRSARFARLDQEWQAALDQVAGDPPRKPAAGKLAARQIARAHRRVLRWGREITPASPPESLHELRKRAKVLRYLLEVFASLHDPAQQWQAVDELKALQDCLGEFQDTEVQRTELRDFAGQMMEARTAPAATLLAMGEIAAGLAVRQHKARADFAGRFAEFSSPKGVARISALTAAAS